MNEALEKGTWARLKPDTPFDKIFPDRLVPIVSPLPIPVFPSDEDSES